MSAMSEPGLPRRRGVATGHVVRRRFRRVLLACSAVAVASGCGIEPDAAPRPVPLEQRALFGGQATGDIAAGSSRIYLLAPTGQDEPARLRSVLRDVGDDPEALLTSLFAGPNADEADAQLVSRIPPDLELRSVRQVGRTLNVDLATGFGDLAARCTCCSVRCSRSSGTSARRSRSCGPSVCHRNRCRDHGCPQPCGLRRRTTLDRAVS
jgi:hypothetical protein